MGDTMICNSNRAEYNELTIKIGCSSFSGWEWLKWPALLIVAIGGLGLFVAYGESAARWLAFLRMPPVWSCCVMVFGGGMLWAFSAAATKTRQHEELRRQQHKNWRSL
jgi:hypothetical protein